MSTVTPHRTHAEGKQEEVMGKTLIVAGVIALTALFIAAQKAFPCDGPECRPCAPEYVTQINQQEVIAQNERESHVMGFVGWEFEKVLHEGKVEQSIAVHPRWAPSGQPAVENKSGIGEVEVYGRTRF